VVETDGGLLELKMGGNRLFIDGREVAGEDTIMGEYPKLYARMAELVRAGQSEVDLAPMVHVADALTLGKRVVTDAFHF
jgi:D-galactose 1-dehydrogenase